MPNTPCLIGQCASAFVTGNNADQEDSEKTYSLMSAVGKPDCSLCAPNHSCDTSRLSFPAALLYVCIACINSHEYNEAVALV